MILGLNFGESVFMHSILLVTDTYKFNLHFWNEFGWYKNFFRNYEIYIGDSEVFSENEKCPGGPHMKLDDPNNYAFSQYAYD